MYEIKLTLKYWRTRIIPAAFRASFSFKSVGSKVFGVVAGFVAFAILVFAGLPGQVPGTDEVVAAVLKLVLAAILTGLGTFFLYVLYLPARTYEQLGGFIENPFEITPGPQRKMHMAQVATLQVKNNFSTADIEDCSLVLLGVQDLETNELIPRDPEAFIWNDREHVDNERGKQELTVSSDIPRLCDIAGSFGPEIENAFFRTQYTEGMRNLRPGRYRLSIRALGKWQGRIISFPYLVDLRYIPVTQEFIPDEPLKIERIEELHE